MEKPIPMHLWRHWNGSDSTRNRLNLDEFPSNYKIVPIWSLVLANWYVHKGFKLLLVLTFWRMLRFCPFLSNCFPSSFPVFHHVLTWFTPCFHLKTSSLKSNHLDIPPSLNGDVFLPKVCTLHSVSPLHLAATTSKVRGVFNVFPVFWRVFFMVSKWRDCWIAMMIWHTSVLDKRYS